MPQAPGVAPRTRTLGIAVDVVTVGALGVTVSAVGAWGVARVGWEEELGAVGVGASAIQTLSPHAWARHPDTDCVVHAAPTKYTPRAVHKIYFQVLCL